MKDIAKVCGVSPATVSYVLNNKSMIGAETRERVLKAIEELNYRPSAIARGLSSKRMNSLGVVFPYNVDSPILNPYYAPLLDGIMRVALREHQNTTLYTGHDWVDARSSLPLFQDGRTDGLILISPRVELDIVEALAQTGTPTVVIDDDDRRVSAVYIDDVAVGRVLTEYLIGIGHRRIAMFCGSRGARCVPRRQQGYEEAFQNARISHDPSLSLPGDFERESAHERVDQILDMPKDRRPTAIVCTNDLIAVLSLERLIERGVDVPGDISIVGVDDTREASFCTPRLTTVRQPLGEMGIMATEMLLNQIRNESPVRYRKAFKTELIVRESTAPPRY